MRRRRVARRLGAHAAAPLSTGKRQAAGPRARAALGLPDDRRGALAVAAQHPGDQGASLLDHLAHAAPKGLASTRAPCYASAMALEKPAGIGRKKEISLD